MNRTFLSVIVLLTLFVFGVVAIAHGEANWVSLKGTSSAESPFVEVLQSNQNETVIRFTVNGFLSENRSENGSTYQSYSLPGCPGTLRTGNVELPFISELVGIPGNANVRVSVIDRREVTLSGYAVYPDQQNRFYPEKQAAVGEPGIWRDIRVVNLKVNPIRYNPATGQIKACTEMTVKLDYSGTSDINVLEVTGRPVKPNYDRMYRALVLNYDDLNLEVEVPSLRAGDDDSYDYLILCGDRWLDHIQPFIEWKESLGFKTRVMSRTELIIALGLSVEENWLPPNLIRPFLTAEHLVHPFSYILIVGNNYDIPLGIVGDVFDRSDYDYTRVVGVDRFPDVGVGRFSVSKVEELQNMINKSITFQSNPPPGDWLEKSLMIAGYQWAAEDNSFQDCSDWIQEPTWRIGARRKTYSVLHPNFVTAYGASYEEGGDEATNEDVCNFINEGCRLVNYRGNGNILGWHVWNLHQDGFYVGAVNGLDNGQKTPVIFAIGNATLYFDFQTEGGYTANLGEAFTSYRPDGAVAYLGAARGTEDFDLNPYAGNYYDRHLYAAVFEEGINAIGDASNYAAIKTDEYFYQHFCSRMFWLGDPSLQLIYHGDAVASSPGVETTGKNLPDEMPGKVELYANYPNPFNPTTEICFSLPHASHVKLEVFNITGQKVSTLVDEYMSAGPHVVTFNGRNQASGMYLYRLTTGQSVLVKKMMLVK